MKAHVTLFFALLLACTGAAQAAKIDICHIPPGNPGNFHTITINTSALPAHQAHGDLVGSCLTNCGTLCDDGNKCTIDVVPSTTECLCQAAPKPPVDCSDGRACTTESCDPAQGCLSTPVVCQSPNPCTVSVCSEPGGTCEETPVVCPTGQSCNANTGACESTGPPSCGNCLMQHSSPGCEVAACQAFVCGLDSSCCTLGWHAGCVFPGAVFGCVGSGICTNP